jgi:hypothetical protein
MVTISNLEMSNKSSSFLIMESFGYLGRFFIEEYDRPSKMAILTMV